MKAFRRLFALFFAHWPTTLAAFACMAVVSVSVVLMVSLIGALFDSLSAGGGQGTSVFLARGLENVQSNLAADIGALLPREGMAVPVFLVMVLVAKNLFKYFAEVLINMVGLIVVRDLRQDLYDSILGRSVRFVSERGTGELTSRVIADVERIQASVGRRFGDLIQDTLSVVILLVYVVSLNPMLSVISLTMGPLVVFPILRLTKRLRRTAMRSQERLASLMDILQETIRGQRIVKAFAMEGFEKGRFAELNHGYFQTLLKEVRIQALATPLMEVVGGVGFVAILAFAHGQIQSGQASIGSFMSFVSGLALLYDPIRRLNKGNLVLQQALAGAERVFDLLDEEDDMVDRPDALAAPPFADSIRFDAMSFSYRADEPLLDQIDLEITRGEVVAFVGASGAGKSTIVHLLPRFYDPTAGRILFDGRDLRDLTQRSLRRQIGLVTQDVFLFNDTIRRNIAYGHDEVDLEKVRGAARSAFADDFIQGFPDGYETVVGEAGVRLSGGQKQRIAIARALLKDPPILILDEATSALDVESERMVQRALDNLMRDRTSLVVAHRLSTIRQANRIVVLEAGRIVEVGRHEDLLVADGVYARLHRLHSFDGEITSDQESI